MLITNFKKHTKLRISRYVFILFYFQSGQRLLDIIAFHKNTTAFHDVLAYTPIYSLHSQQNYILTFFFCLQLYHERKYRESNKHKSV